MKFVLALLSLIIAATTFAQTEKTYLLKVEKLYDSESNSFLRNQEILVKGKKIEKVGTNLQAEGAEVVNLKSCTVTPGLIDAHTHVLTIQKMDDPLEADLFSHSDMERSLRAVGILRSYLDAGVTTVRDLGNSGMFLDLNLKRALQKGWVVGPRMVISGPIMSPEDGQFFNLPSHNRHVIEDEYRVIKNVEDARQAVKDHISKGADVIKVVMGDGRITLPLEEVQMIVKTAHSFGIKVTAHATYDAVIDRALEAGVDGIEHGYGVSDSLLDKMAKKKVYLVPTISPNETFQSLLTDNKAEWSEQQRKGLTDFIKRSEGIIKRAYEKGVMVVFGSDMYIYTKSTTGAAAKATVEFLYNSCGKANDALRSATKWAAIAAGVDRQAGVIKEKMNADIVAFDGDLEKDFVKGLRKVRFVMHDGVIYLNQ